MNLETLVGSVDLESLLLILITDLYQAPQLPIVGPRGGKSREHPSVASDGALAQRLALRGYTQAIPARGLYKGTTNTYIEEKYIYIYIHIYIEIYIYTVYMYIHIYVRTMCLSTVAKGLYMYYRVCVSTAAKATMQRRYRILRKYTTLYLRSFDHRTCDRQSMLRLLSTVRPWYR